jgi:hypothetical protein
MDLLHAAASATPVSVTSFATASVSPSGSTVILAAYMRTGAATGGNPTVSGLGLKWTLLRFNVRGNVNLFYVWKGEGTATTGTVTVTAFSGDTFTDHRHQLVDCLAYSDVVQYEIKDQSTASVNGDIDAHFTSEATSAMLAFHSVRTSDYTFTNDDAHYTQLAETRSTGYGTIWGGYSEESEVGSYGDWSSAVTSVKQSFVVECRQPSECPFTVLDSYAIPAAVSATTADIVTQDSSILPGGDVCYFAIQIRHGTYTGDATLTGCGYTWTIQEDTITSSLNRLIVFKGSGTPSSGALTFAMAGSDTYVDYRYVLLEAPGYDLVVQSAENSLATAVTSNDLTFGFTTGASSLTLGFEAFRGTEAYWTHDDADYRAINMVNTNNLGELVTYWSPNQESQMFGDWSLGGVFPKHAVAIEVAFAAATLKIVSEALNLVEGTVQAFTAVKVLSEALNIVEGSVRASAAFKIVSEALNMAESVVKTLYVQVTKVVNEALNMTEGTVKKFLYYFVRVVSEGLNLTEGAVNKLYYVVTKVVNEALSLAETVAKQLGITKIVNEALNFVEATFAQTMSVVIHIFRDVIHGTRTFADGGLSAIRKFKDDIFNTRTQR